MPLQEIEKLTKDYSEARQQLRDRVTDLDDQINALKKKALPGIRRAVEAAAARESVLRVTINAYRGLFNKPRSLVFYGIKVGLQKAKGTLSWESDSTVVKAIKRLFPDSWETYVKVDEKPIKTALASMPAVDLKKLGVTVTNDADEVLIKSTDSDIDKLVNALLKTDAEVEG